MLLEEKKPRVSQLSFYVQALKVGSLVLMDDFLSLESDCEREPHANLGAFTSCTGLRWRKLNEEKPWNNTKLIFRWTENKD